MASSAAVIAGGMVASSIILVVGLYLVLPREVAAPVAAPAVAAPIQPPPQPEAPQPEVPQPEAPRVATAEQQRQAAETVRRALETRRADLVQRCWAPAVAVQSEPRRIALAFNIAFAPTGTVVAIGLSEDPAAHRSDVANCVRETPLALEIPAPGAPLHVEVPFTLP